MVIQKEFVAMDINHGYKRYLFGKVFKIVKIKGRISCSKHEYVLIILNNYFDKLNQKYDWQNTTYDFLIKRLTKVAEILIKSEEEKEQEELDLINIQAIRFAKIAI